MDDDQLDNAIMSTSVVPILLLHKVVTKLEEHARFEIVAQLQLLQCVQLRTRPAGGM